MKTSLLFISRCVFIAAAFLQPAFSKEICDENLVASAKKIEASSERSLRRVQEDFVVWNAKLSDPNQYLDLAFEEVTRITQVTVEVEKESASFVKEFKLQFLEGDIFRDYQDGNGWPMVFIVGNELQSSFRLEYLVLTKRLRVVPVKWQNRIHIRFSAHGCKFEAKEVAFDGTPFKVELASNSYQFDVQLRFKTTQENGVIFHCTDLKAQASLVLYLQETRLILGVSSPEKDMSMTVGNMLDDNLFHQVELVKSEQDLSLIMDGQRVTRDLHDSSLSEVNFLQNFILGGNGENMTTSEAFKGCIGHLTVNTQLVNISRGKKSCSSSPTTANKIGLMSFTTTSSHLKIDLKNRRLLSSSGFSAANGQALSFNFRTFEPDALILYHGLQPGWIRVSLENSRIKVNIEAGASSSTSKYNVQMDSFDASYNDGKWHILSLAFAEYEVNLTIDSELLTRRLASKIELGNQYLFGGGFEAEIPGFVGCIQDLRILSSLITLKSKWVEFPEKEVVEAVCVMDDKCSPNPCQHGGICKQNSRDFYCECDGTGYSGALCHTSLSYRSCMDFSMGNPAIRYVETTLDLDGSGPLPPFQGRCEFLPGGRNITYIGHLNEEATKVDGFDEKGSFMQVIHYGATYGVIEALIDQSGLCSQKLGYECKQSRLFNSPINNSTSFSPFGYWTSRTGQIMDFWAGSEPGSFKCECGYVGACFDVEKWCNCDSAHDDWLWDGGEITQKEFLPVKSLHFGDTGTPLDGKEGRFSLGPLECEGRDLKTNTAVTFHMEEGAIEVALDSIVQGDEQAWDVYFEFKSGIPDVTGTIFHSVHPIKGDVFKVTIVNGSLISVICDLGGLEDDEEIQVHAGDQTLSDNQWHSLMVEWNVKETTIYLDKNASVVEKPHKQAPHRTLSLARKVSVGATIDFAGGFLGCFRSFWVNGYRVDLKGQMHPKGVHGVSLGCHGACEAAPCQNGGKCIERYSNYSCDCSKTAFEGQMCDEDVGITFDGTQSVAVNLTGSVNNSGGFRAEIGFAFASTSPDSEKFIMETLADNNQSILLKLNKKGQVVVELDLLGEDEEFTYEPVLDSSDFHTLRLESFDMGRQIYVRIDDLTQQAFTLQNSSLANCQWSRLGIGMSSRQNLAFRGCLSRFLYAQDIAPLKLLLESSSRIVALEEATLPQEWAPAQKVEFCGNSGVKLAREVDNDNFTEKTLRGGGRRNVTKKQFGANSEVGDDDEDSDDGSNEQSRNSGSLFLLVCFCALVIFAVGYSVGKYVKRHTGVYKTREDAGEVGATDADTAVLHSKTGHLVEKKQEWFI